MGLKMESVINILLEQTMVCVPTDHRQTNFPSRGLCPHKPSKRVNLKPGAMITVFTDHPKPWFVFSQTITLALTLIFLLLFNSLSIAQVKEGMRINVANGKVYVYHNKINNQGFNIYRDGQQLNEVPIQGLIYSDELPQALGDDYDRLAGMIGADSPSNLFFKLKSDKALGRLASFLYPDVAEAMGLLFVDENAPIGQQATYKIEFVDDTGEPINESLELTATLQEKNLVIPQNLEASHKGERVTLTWEYPKAKADDKIIQFHVYEKTQQGDVRIGNEVIIRNNANETHELIFEVEQIGVEQTFFVKAVDISGRESTPSQIITYNITDDQAPNTIGGINATARGSSIVLSWSTGTDADLAGYYVYRSPRMRDGYQKITSKPLDPLTTFFVDSTAREGHNFSYKVTAVDLSENESEMSLAAMTRINDNVAPDAVQNLQAVFNGETVDVSWDPLKATNSYRTYIVLRQQINSGNKTFARLNQDDLRVTAWTDIGRSGKGFLEGAIYKYCVMAIDSARNMSDSTLVTIQIPDNTPPAAPGSLQAANEDGLYVMLRWNASTSADTKSYKIMRSLIDSTSRELVLLPKTQRNFRDNEVQKGKKYIYSVTAIDSLGNESASTQTDTVWVKDSDPPRSVRNVVIRLGENIITWEPVVAFDLAGYNIYQADIATGKFEKLNSSPVEETQWTANGIEEGKWYRVRSVDISGNESKPSEPRQAKR